MFRTSPPRFALACLALWVVQLVLSLLLAWHWWALSSSSMQWVLATQIVAGVLLGLLILVQLPRALQWRPRRNPRPSAELQAERQRIARELHDNIGSQLVNTMVLLDPQVPAQSQALRALEQCMLDLRLVVDSMDSGTDSLIDRLARLRHRMQPVLDRRGIDMAWHVHLAGDADTLDAARAQHMVAIVQEALSNVLQHAQATQVTVRLSHSQDGEQGRWQLDICDNGRGVSQASMAARAPSSGFGLEGMHARARQIGAVLELMRRDGGAPASAWCSLTAAAPTPCTQSNAARRPCWMAGEGGGGPLLVGCW